MSFFEFPHTRTYDSDLGWLIVSMKKLISEMDEFVDFNKIKFADPITWSIDRNYEATTVVVDDNGSGYISQKPVPAGVPLSDTNYWTQIFAFGELLDILREQITAANEKTKNTASAPRSNGDLVFLNGLLYVVTEDMPIGTEYIEGSNIEKITIEELIKNDITGIKELIQNEATARKNEDEILLNAINAEASARENEDKILLNSINAEASARENAINTEASARENADNALSSRIDNIRPYANNDIRNYGGVGDGVTDNTTAFNECMKANNSVYFPNYVGCIGYLMKEVVLKDGQSVNGDAGSVILYDRSNYLFTIIGSNIDVYSLEIKCTNSGKIFMTKALSKIEYIHLTDIITYDSAGLYDDSESTSNYTNLYLNRITCRKHKGVGFKSTHAYAFIFLENVTIDSVGLTGNWHDFHFENNAGLHLVHCEAEGGASDGTHVAHVGFYFKNCQAVWLDRCMSDSLDGSGFYMDGAANQYFYYNECVSSLCKSHGFLINGQYISIIGGYQQGSKSQETAIQGAHGIYCFASNVSINGIYLVDNSGYGLAFAAGTNITASGIQSKLNGLVGYYVANGTSGILSGCSTQQDGSEINNLSNNFFYRDLFNGTKVSTNIV